MTYTQTKAKAKQLKKNDPVLKELSEKLVHIQVATFLNMQYPNVIFSSDASGLRVSIGLRQEIARKSPDNWKVPDLIIMEPNKSKGYCGLALELKKKGEGVYKRNGNYKNEHLAEQAKTLAALKAKGYCASFAIGFDEAVSIIKDYLKP